MSKKTYISPAGGKYEGDFKDGQRHGKGTYIYPSGSKYVGEYKDDKKHGQGTYTWADGRVWQGQWKDNKWVSGRKYAAGEYNPPRVADNRESSEQRNPDEVVPAASGSGRFGQVQRPDCGADRSRHR